MIHTGNRYIAKTHKSCLYKIFKTDHEKEIAEKNLQEVNVLLHEKESECFSLKSEHSGAIEKIVNLELLLARAHEDHSEHKKRLEFRLDEVDKHILEVMVEKEELEQKILIFEVC